MASEGLHGSKRPARRQVPITAGCDAQMPVHYVCCMCLLRGQRL
jgi:hypothetical protein